MSTFVLIHGAGDVGWYWHLVAAEPRGRVHDVVAPDLPGDDESATLTDYTVAVIEAVGFRMDLVANHTSLAGHKVAIWAAAQPPTVKTHDILNYLVRGVGDEWDRHEIEKIAAQTIRQAKELFETPEYQRLHTTLTERGAL